MRFCNIFTKFECRTVPYNPRSTALTLHLAYQTSMATLMIQINSDTNKSLHPALILNPQLQATKFQQALESPHQLFQDMNVHYPEHLDSQN